MHTRFELLVEPEWLEIVGVLPHTLLVMCRPRGEFIDIFGSCSGCCCAPAGASWWNAFLRDFGYTVQIMCAGGLRHR